MWDAAGRGVWLRPGAVCGAEHGTSRAWQTTRGYLDATGRATCVVVVED